jgi:hypothetical protein
VLSRAPGGAAWANADSGVIAPTIPIVAVGAIPPDLNIDALRHLELLGLDRIGGRRSRQHRCGCRHGEKRCNDTNGSTFKPGRCDISATHSLEDTPGWKRNRRSRIFDVEAKPRGEGSMSKNRSRCVVQRN